MMGAWMHAEQRENCENSLLEFVKAAWPFIDSSQFQNCWAIEAFCEHLEAVTYGYIDRLLANYPPRASKTTIGSICWPVWTWIQRQKTFRSGPQVRFLCGSYNAALSLKSATSSRRLILTPWFQENWGSRFQLTEDQNTKSQYDNSAGGSRISTSVGGSLLGLGGDIINVDDPHNTETEKLIETDADLKKVESWSKELFSTRLNSPEHSAIVVTMQRVSEGDMSGVILKSIEEGGEDWTHLMIPMEFDEARRNSTIILPRDMANDDPQPWEDPREKEGELMWPERFSAQRVREMRRIMGPYMASGRLQQMPVPKGGGIIKQAFWRPWDNEEAKLYDLEWGANRKEFPPMTLVVGSLDTAFKEKEENDYNALTIWGIWLDKMKNRRAMLMFGWAKRLPLHGEEIRRLDGETAVAFKARQKENWGLVEWVTDSCRRYGVKRLLIEDKARGHDVAKEINRLYARENWGVEMTIPIGDKTTRGHSIVPMFSDGGVYAPETLWSRLVIDQCALVPKSTHDDLYDTVTQFLWWARDNEILVRADEMSAALEDEMSYKKKQLTVAQSYGVT